MDFISWLAIAALFGLMVLGVAAMLASMFDVDGNNKERW